MSELAASYSTRKEPTSEASLLAFLFLSCTQCLCCHSARLSLFALLKQPDLNQNYCPSYVCPFPGSYTGANLCGKCRRSDIQKSDTDPQVRADLWIWSLVRGVSCLARSFASILTLLVPNVTHSKSEHHIGITFIRLEMHTSNQT